MATYTFHHLDARTRSFMTDEVRKDFRESCLYESKRMTDAGKARYRECIVPAVQTNDEDWLESQLSGGGLFETAELREGKVVKTPESQVRTFAHGEFNRFYCRGLSARAIDEGIEELEVYRARPSDDPRSKSEQLIGKRFFPAILLNDLRARFGRETLFGLGGPNSGICVRIPV